MVKLARELVLLARVGYRVSFFSLTMPEVLLRGSLMSIGGDMWLNALTGSLLLPVQVYCLDGVLACATKNDGTVTGEVTVIPPVLSFLDTKTYWRVTKSHTSTQPQTCRFYNVHADRYLVGYPDQTPGRPELDTIPLPNLWLAPAGADINHPNFDFVPIPPPGFHEHTLRLLECAAGTGPYNTLVYDSLPAADSGLHIPVWSVAQLSNVFTEAQGWWGLQYPLP